MDKKQFKKLTREEKVKYLKEATMDDLGGIKGLKEIAKDCEDIIGKKLDILYKHKKLRFVV